MCGDNEHCSALPVAAEQTGGNADTPGLPNVVFYTIMNFLESDMLLKVSCLSSESHCRTQRSTR